MPLATVLGHHTRAKAKSGTKSETKSETRSGPRSRHADWPLISPKLVVVVFLLVSSSVGGYFIYKRVREGGASGPRPTTSPPEGTTPPETTPPEGTPPEGTPPQAPPPPGDSNGDSDNTGTLAGAVVGSILGTALLFGVGFAIYSRVKKSTDLSGYIETTLADQLSRLSIQGDPEKQQEEQERP